MKVEQERDPVLSQVSKWLRAGERPQRKDVEGGGRELLSYWAQWDRLAHKDELIWRRWEQEGTDNVLCEQLCISRELAPQILQELHDSPSSGHMGVARTVARVRERFHWFGLCDDVESHVRACTACAQTDDPSLLPRASLISVKAGHPLQKVAIDIIAPLPRSSSGHEWLLEVSDYFTKFAQVYPVRNTTSVTLANRVMDEYICRFGCFESLHSDQGANVDGAVFRVLCDLIYAAKTRTTPYHPQGDGQVDRLNKAIVKILSKLIEEQQRDWAAYVPKALLAYNSSVHDSTGYTPFRLMFGREACLPIDVVLRLDSTTGETGTYQEYVAQATELLVRENQPSYSAIETEVLLRCQMSWSTVSSWRSSMVRKQSKEEVHEALVWTVESGQSPV